MVNGINLRKYQLIETINWFQESKFVVTSYNLDLGSDTDTDSDLPINNLILSKKYCILSLDSGEINQKAIFVRDLPLFVEFTDCEYTFETRAGSLGCGGLYLCAMMYIDGKPSEL